MKIKGTWIAAAALITTAVAWRIINNEFGLAPNLEIVTASVLVASTFLPWRMAVLVPLGILAISDVLIGNSPIVVFTWSAFAIIALGGLVLRRMRDRPGKLVLASLGAAVAGSLWFFAWTNFGVWLMGDGTMYPHTWSGLVQCYVMGLPFYRTMLLGNLVLVPAYFAVAAYGPALQARLSAWQLRRVARG